MNNTPEISVIVPAWNEEKFIESCLYALQQQKTKAFCEIIVVNNNSSDSTVNIVEKFAGITLLNEPRQGVSFARNTGVKKAQGKIIVFIDADIRFPAYVYYITL